MSQYNPCIGCDKRTVTCHAHCEDYAALQADNAARRAYRAAHRSTAADEVLGRGIEKRRKNHRKLKRR